MAIAPKQAVKATTKALTLRFGAGFVDALDGYVAYLGGATDRAYVVEQAVRQAIRSDKAYRAQQRAEGPPPASQGASGSDSAAIHPGTAMVALQGE